MVPESWDIHKLGDLISHTKGFAFKSKSYAPSGVRVIRISDTTRNSVKPYGAVYINEKEANNLKRYELNTNDLILTTVGSRPHLLDSMVGKLVRIPKVEAGALLNQNMVKLAPKKAMVEPDYLYETLKNERFIYFISTLVRGNANQVSISLKEFFSYKIPVPPLPEQKKIAQILSTWDKAITTTEKLLKNSQQQKKALMQQLLTGKKRLLDDNGVRFNGKWKKVNLENLCTVNPKKEPEPSNRMVSFISMDSVSEDARLKSFENKKYDEVSKGYTAFKDNDVILAKITPCFENGKGAYIYDLTNGVGFGSTEFHVLRAKKGISSRYIYYITCSYEFRTRGEANMQGSAGQKRVTTDYIKALKVLLPALYEEQQAISKVLSKADLEIDCLQQKIDYLKQEKKALMQQLLTGKRRVRID